LSQHDVDLFARECAFQVYLMRDRGFNAELIERARAAQRC
jgi:hypothetical protein